MNKQEYENIFEAYKKMFVKEEKDMSRYKCPCGWIYDPKEHGGKPFSEWPGPCPESGTSKSKFKKMDVSEMSKQEHIFIKEADEGNDPDGFNINIEKVTLENTNFRKVLYTAPNLQLVLMSVKDEIGMEVHDNGDQFIRIESGEGKAIIDGKEYELKDGSAFIIPEDSEHNVVNTGKDDLKLYSVYAPPHHPNGVIDKTRNDAIEREKAGE